MWHLCIYGTNKIKCYNNELSFGKIDTCHALIDCHVKSLWKQKSH
jgi:hypothetical protein